MSFYPSLDKKLFKFHIFQFEISSNIIISYMLNVAKTKFQMSNISEDKHTLFGRLYSISNVNTSDFINKIYYICHPTVYIYWIKTFKSLKSKWIFVRQRKNP